MGTVVALGFAAAVVYGTSDFLGGYAARSLPALRVTLLAFAAGTATSVLLLPLVASNWSRVAITYGAVAGAAAARSIWLLYSALAIGPVSVVAPLVAVIAALVPVAYGLTHGERLGVPGETAIGAVVVSGALLAYDRAGGSHLTARALLTGIGAGVVTGAYLVALDLTPPSSGAAPVVVEFAVGTGVLGAAPRPPPSVQPARRAGWDQASDGSSRPAPGRGGERSQPSSRRRAHHYRHPPRRSGRHGRPHRPVPARHDRLRSHHHQRTPSTPTSHRSRPRHRRERHPRRNRQDPMRPRQAPPAHDGGHATSRLAGDRTRIPCDTNARSAFGALPRSPGW